MEAIIMQPRLYDAVASTTAYDNNGYGFFSTCSKCEVTEERNGVYSLSMIITDRDPLADTAIVGMFIKAKANQYDKPQLFEINEIICDSSNGSITINANHIKFLGFQNTASNNSNYSNTYHENPSEVVNDLLSDSIIENNVFTFSSDITEKKDFNYKGVASKKIGDIIGNSEGSVLEVYGGELHYDNFKIELLKSRGSDSGKKIMFGYNMSDYKQTMTNDTDYTHCIGYATFDKADENATDKTITLVGDPTVSTKHSIIFPKVKLIDFTDKVKNDVGSDFKVRTDIADDIELIKDLLYYYSNEYVIRNGWSEPNVNIVITYRPELDKLQDIKLCDTVTVCFGRSKKSIKTKITKVVYDSILERYILVEVGNKSLSLYDFLSKTRR